MGAAFDVLGYVYSYRVALPSGGTTRELLFRRLFRDSVAARVAAADCPNWNSQRVVELTVRCYHPESFEGDQGVPDAAWRQTDVAGVLMWLPCAPEPLADLADPAVRAELLKTIRA